MIIVNVFHSFWPVLGGIERVIYAISKEMIKRGHEVYVITTMLQARNKPKYEKFEGIHIYRIKAFTLYYPDLTIPMESAGDIFKKVNIVHGWTQASFFTYKLLKSAKEKYRKHVITSFIGIDYLQYHYNSLIRLIGYPYQKHITKRLCKISELILTTNKYEKEMLKRRYNINSYILPHGIDEKYFKLPNISKYFRKKYNIQEKIISYIGRIHPSKGLDLLIKAFADVSNTSDNVILVIAGKGDKVYLKKCIKLADKLGIANKIRYLGYLSENDKIGLIDASDIVVLPTRHAGESYPLLMNEVNSRGKILLATLPYPSSALRYYQNNGLIRFTENRTLSQAIIKYLRDSSKVMKTTTKIITWSDVADKLIKLYEAILK